MSMFENRLPKVPFGKEESVIERMQRIEELEIKKKLELKYSLENKSAALLEKHFELK